MRRTSSIVLPAALLASALVALPMTAGNALPSERSSAPATRTAATARAVTLDIESRKRIRTGTGMKFTVTGTTDVRRALGVTYAPKGARRDCAASYAEDTADQWTYKTVEPGPFTVKDRILASAFGPGRIKLCAYLTEEGTGVSAVASTTVVVRKRR